MGTYVLWSQYINVLYEPVLAKSARNRHFSTKIRMAESSLFRVQAHITHACVFIVLLLKLEESLLPEFIFIISAVPGLMVIEILYTPRLDLASNQCVFTMLVPNGITPVKA